MQKIIKKNKNVAKEIWQIVWRKFILYYFLWLSVLLVLDGCCCCLLFGFQQRGEFARENAKIILADTRGKKQRWFFFA